MRLGEAQRITGDARISFRGAGPARFRLEHARDCNGAPDGLSWCEVSQANNGATAPPTAEGLGHGRILNGVLVDVVDGDTDVLYRRHNAGWLRVVPHDTDDEEGAKRCGEYTIALGTA